MPCVFTRHHQEHLNSTLDSIHSIKQILSISAENQTELSSQKNYHGVIINAMTSVFCYCGRARTYKVAQISNFARSPYISCSSADPWNVVKKVKIGRCIRPVMPSPGAACPAMYSAHALYVTDEMVCSKLKGFCGGSSGHPLGQTNSQLDE